MRDKDRNVYLELVSVPAAVERAKELLDRGSLVKAEAVPSHEASGRVLAEPVFARLSSPTFHSAAMDGFAVRASDTFGAREGSPLALVEGETCRPVNTGHPLPEGTDAVVMIENVARVDERTIHIEAPAFPWQHVRRIGEDIVATELLFPRNHTLTPYDVGSLLGGGIWEVKAWERVRIHFIPTGDEVLDFTARPEPRPGQVVESNTQVLSALARQLGCVPSRCAPVRDDLESLTRAARAGLESGAHVVVLCAGSSAGSKDFTRQVMERLGRVAVHGISAMPGKPSLVGEAQGRLMVGAPGYPVSAVVCFEEVLAPVLAWLVRAEPPERAEVEVELARRSPSKLGITEYLRLAVGTVGRGRERKHVATPLGRGAGNISTLSRAQAVARIPAHVEGVEQGEAIMAQLLVPGRALEKILVAVGSHDNTLDVLADALMGLDDPVRLASSHVGSMGGLMAVKNGSCHLAGAHLFDPESGDYNFPFLARHLPGVEVRVVNLAIRHQGLMVPKGNPLSIRGVEDLASGRVRFVNRQRGAGTRILLDYHLNQAGMAPDQVDGYGKEEFTHMGVAVNVLTGAADCGLGIRAAARALGLDFVPLARERYDLVIPAVAMDDPKVAAMLGLLRDPAFQARIRAMEGYETDLTGRDMSPGMGLGG